MYEKAALRKTRLRNYFAEIEKNTASVPLRMKYVNVDNNLDLGQVVSINGQQFKNRFPGWKPG